MEAREMPERRDDPMRLWVGNWVPESVEPRKDKPKQAKARSSKAGSAKVESVTNRRTPELKKKIA
jgi:hypothetical protein